MWLRLPEHKVTAPAARGTEAHPPRTPRVSPRARLTWAVRHSRPTTDDPHHHRKNSRVATLPTGIHLHGPVPGLFKGKSAQLVRYGLIFEPFNDPAWAKPPHRRPVRKRLCDMQRGMGGGFLLQKGASVRAADPACRVPPDVCHPFEDQAAARAGRAERRKEPGVTLPR